MTTVSCKQFYEKNLAAYVSRNAQYPSVSTLQRRWAKDGRSGRGDRERASSARRHTVGHHDIPEAVVSLSELFPRDSEGKDSSGDP